MGQCVSEKKKPRKSNCGALGHCFMQDFRGLVEEIIGSLDLGGEAKALVGAVEDKVLHDGKGHRGGNPFGVAV